jgi:hypothetical protein
VPLDFVVVAAAAMRCGCVCTASVCLEMAAEASLFYWQRDQDESEPFTAAPDSNSSPLHKRQVLLTAGGAMTSGELQGGRIGVQLPRGSAGSSTKRFSRLPMELVRDLYQRLHDPDASLGVPASSNHRYCRLLASFIVASVCC